MRSDDGGESGDNNDNDICFADVSLETFLSAGARKCYQLLHTPPKKKKKKDE